MTTELDHCKRVVREFMSAPFSENDLVDLIVSQRSAAWAEGVAVSNALGGKVLGDVEKARVRK